MSNQMLGSGRQFSASLIIFSLLTIFMFAVNTVQAQDPGVPDTVRIEADSLIVGQSRPIKVVLVNDEPLGMVSTPVIFRTLDSGFAQFDSVVFVNRMADPSVLNVRFVVPFATDSVSPDSLAITSFLSLGNEIPSGNSAIAEIYMTGLQTGLMTVDSSWLPSGILFVVQIFRGADFVPQYVSGNIPVVEGTLAPILSFDESNITGISSSILQFEASASSPESFPVTASLTDFSLYDDASAAPVNSPTFTYNSGSGAYDFSWSSTSGDIGIWKATVEACDSIGRCTEREVVIQVVESGEYIIELQRTETENFCFSTFVGSGNFDGDSYPEVAATGQGYFGTPLFAIYDNTGGSTFPEVFDHNDPGLLRRGLQICYLNDDNLLDIVQCYHLNIDRKILVFIGDGDNGFSSIIESDLDSNDALLSGIGNVDGDEFLDYIIGGRYQIYTYSGSSTNEFSLTDQIYVEDSIMTLSYADFNNDSYTDIAVGFREGLKVLLADGLGSFVLDSTYSQLFGSVNIEVTNEGSDFNEDNYYDLCIATPSIGDSSSELVVYLGNGDGSFEQIITRTVLGQICANTPGDFNNDGHLDIAYLNSSRRYLGILYGDGDGNFTNELRFDVPKFDPQRIVAMDSDLDGDLDIVVVSSRIPDGSSLFYYENQNDPGSYSETSVALTGEDNAQMELVSPSNKKLTRISSTIPSAHYYRRSTNANSMLDDYANLNLVENGEYLLTVSPDPAQPAGTPFTLEFEKDGMPYRLAKDAVMSSGQYEFGLDLAGGGSSIPASGSFIATNPPLFMWPNKSNMEFQLATDLDFNSVIVETTITGSSFQPASALPVSDTATFYWRVKPSGAAEYGPIYAFNLIASSSNCGDVDGIAGPINILDLNYMVNRVFRNGPPPPNPAEADMNGDGDINILDLNVLVNYIFRGQPLPNCS